MDDIRLTQYNVDERADEFYYYFTNMSVHFRNNLLMHTFGDDYCYSNANM